MTNADNGMNPHFGSNPEDTQIRINPGSNPLSPLIEVRSNGGGMLSLSAI